MKVLSFLIADNIQKDPRNNKLNIEGVFSEIYAKSFPAVHKSLSTILIFKGVNKKYKYELFLDYQGRKLKITEANFTKTASVHNIISNMKGLPLFGKGEYTFEAKLNGRLVASTTIEARVE